MKALFLLPLLLIQACDLHAQGTAMPVPTKAPAAPKPEETAAKIKKENEDALKRIKEIEGIVFPVQEEEAQKLFGLQKGEYTFLRMQAETPESATQFFEKQKSVDRESFKGVALYFDETYTALQAGDYWVGREGSLVRDDSALYAELQDKVMSEIRSRPDGEKIVNMLAERDTLLSKLKTSKPLYKYLSERRLWWKNHPEYEEVVKEDVEKKNVEMAQ
jgi:hypothetical protein